MRVGPRPFEASDVLAIGGVPVAGDALDASIMRRRVARHFGAEVVYKVPFGSNVLTMPKPIVELLCSPAHLSVLRRQDIAEAGKSDVQVVEDALAVFLGLRALDEARAQGTLAAEDADRLAVQEVRAVRTARSRA